MQGRIVSCVNQGSLVQVLIETEEGLESIPIDERCFKEMIEMKEKLEGKEIEYSGKYGLVIFQEDKMEEKLDGKEVF